MICRLPSVVFGSPFRVSLFASRVSRLSSLVFSRSFFDSDAPISSVALAGATGAGGGGDSDDEISRPWYCPRNAPSRARPDAAENIFFQFFQNTPPPDLNGFPRGPEQRRWERRGPTPIDKRRDVEENGGGVTAMAVRDCIQILPLYLCFPICAGG